MDAKACRLVMDEDSPMNDKYSVGDVKVKSRGRACLLPGKLATLGKYNFLTLCHDYSINAKRTFL